MKEIILEMKNISKSFGGVKALQSVNLSLNKGEVHVLVGENGAGKSTILKILSGLYIADSGDIFLKGKPVLFRNPQEAQKLGIAMVYQELTVLPWMSVAQNIYLNEELIKSSRLINNKKINKSVQDLIAKYDLNISPFDLVGELPLAKQQMVEILKVLVKDPEIIIFDEPTSALDRNEVNKLFDMIKLLLQHKKTVLFISHRLDEVYTIGCRATVLKDGHNVKTVALNETSPDDLIQLMVGRTINAIFPDKLAVHDEHKVFEAQDLNIKGKIKNVSLHVYRGEVIGIAGLQGHGQSELLNCIAGVIKKDHGRIFINSKEVKINSASQAIRAGVAFVPEDRKIQGLFLNLSIKENISITSLYKRHIMGFIKIREERDFVNIKIKNLSIKAVDLKQLISQLSGGNQQKVVLGKCLAINPKVLLFNEPTRGIDIETKQEFYKLMRYFAKSGVAVIMYSSDLMEVIGMSDRILVMYENKISGEISKEEISEENIMRLAVGMSKTLV